MPVYIEENALIFIGKHPESNEPICGIITSSLDVEHAPFIYQVDRDNIVVNGTGRTVRFVVANDIHAAIAAGAKFYIANIGGSEATHLVPLSNHIRH